MEEHRPPKQSSVGHGRHKSREPTIELLAVRRLADGCPNLRKLSARVQMPKMPRPRDLSGRCGRTAHPRAWFIRYCWWLATRRRRAEQADRGARSATAVECRTQRLCDFRCPVLDGRTGSGVGASENGAFIRQYKTYRPSAKRPP